ncbi:MAG: caspase family protein [Xanthobacteraceae bacterium]
MMNSAVGVVRRCLGAAHSAIRNGRTAAGLIGALILLGSLAPDAASAGETRRAFLVGIQRYSDGYIQRLERAANDAKDLAKDLEEVGFDKKNIKVVTDLSSKDSFEKDFSTFLNTIEAGDDVVFYFSGHGFGVEADQTNYLLFGDLKSPYAFTKSRLSDQERRNADVVRLKIAQYLDEYQKSEIPNGVSANEIQRRIAEKNPKTVIMILDACRSLVQSDAADAQQIKLVKRGDDSGSRLLNLRKPPPGFLILYSASFGEQAAETLGQDDFGRNSLFTGVLRSELQRPGQSAVELGERVKLMVRAIANDKGRQQEPEVFYDEHNSANVDDFDFVGSIGRERFQMSQDRCAGEDSDWDQIAKLQKRDLYDRHIRRFDQCPHGTAELARRALATLALSSDDPIEVTAVTNKAVTDCDRLAASPLDGARPPEVPGVLTEKLDADAAIAACSKAVSDNPRVFRYLFNLGRAYQSRAMRPALAEDERRRALDSARLAYDDAAKRGYISALNDLAVLDELDKNYEAAIDLFKRAAQQGHPLAMYNLALHYRDGIGVQRDFGQAAEWFAKAAESGLVSAMVENAQALTTGRGQPFSRANPRRAVEWLQRAADAGSLRAKYELGRIYQRGARCSCGEGNQSNDVSRDRELALLWFSRAAEAGDTAAQVRVAEIMEAGTGLPSPQPEIAERYWRLAARSGDDYAQVEFANRLHSGLLLVKEEYGEKEVINLLKRAMSQGSAQAAVELAHIYRNGEIGVEKNPVEAMKLAYHAIDLAVLADPTAQEGDPYYEMDAAHLIVDLAKGGEAIDAMGRPLLTPEEIDRLEHYYGAADPVTKKMKVRGFKVPIFCEPSETWYFPKQIWVWDWGRSEAPTELQIRFLERLTRCPYNRDLRATLLDVYAQAKKSKVAFADLLAQRMQTLEGQAQPPQSDREHRRRRR